MIADDAAIVRDGVAALLREHGFDVVATAADAVGLHEAVERHRPDVAVVDIRMPPTHTNEGLVAAEAIRATPSRRPACSSSPSTSSRSTRCGCVRDSAARGGYLLKDRIADADVLRRGGRAGRARRLRRRSGADRASSCGARRRAARWPS